MREWELGKIPFDALIGLDRSSAPSIDLQSAAFKDQSAYMQAAEKEFFVNISAGAAAVSFSEDLISTLGKDTASVEVSKIISHYELTDIYDDPPFRRYIGSSLKGVDLLSESGKICDVQFFTQQSQTHAPFSDELPFGIEGGMSEVDIHALLGKPDIRDYVGSKYITLHGKFNVTAVYDKSNVLSYLSIRKA